jgi:hypothetical protein
VSPGRRQRNSSPPLANPPPPPRAAQIGRKINARFFLAANAALILIALILILVPCVGTLRESKDREGVIRGLICLVTIAGFTSLGLLYSARKGDLGWLSTYQKEDS